MSIAICGYHNKLICKECHHCEDCGEHACIHTERGRYTRELARNLIVKKKILSNEDVLQLQLQVELWENNQLKNKKKELEFEIKQLKKQLG